MKKRIWSWNRDRKDGIGRENGIYMVVKMILAVKLSLWKRQLLNSRVLCMHGPRQAHLAKRLVLQKVWLQTFCNSNSDNYKYIYIYIPWNSKTMKKARCNWITGVCNQNPGFPENHGFPFPAGPQLMPFWPVPRGKDLCQTSSVPSGVKLWCSNGEFPKPKVTN